MGSNFSKEGGSLAFVLRTVYKQAFTRRIFSLACDELQNKQADDVRAEVKLTDDGDDGEGGAASSVFDQGENADHSAEKQSDTVKEDQKKNDGKRHEKHKP